jgi:hypothetical protein
MEQAPAIVLSGGGERAVAWEVGVLAAGRSAIVVTTAPRRPAPASLEAVWNEALAREVLRVDATVIHASISARAAMGDDLMSAAGAHRAVAVGRLQGRGGVERPAAQGQE